MRYGEELALGPWPNLDHKMEMSPASWVGGSMRDNGLCPVKSLRASLHYWCSLNVMHCYSAVPGNAQLAIWAPSADHTTWPVSLCFKVICHLTDRYILQQLKTPGLRIQKDGGERLCASPVVLASGSCRCTSCELRMELVSEVQSLFHPSTALSGFSVLHIMRSSSKKQQFNNLPVGSLWLNTSHVSSFKYFFQYLWEERHFNFECARVD